MNVNQFIATSLCVIVLNLVSFNSIARSNEQQNYQQQVFSQAELAQILAPIALYPDVLLTHILIASTYPLEVIQAQRYLKNHADLDKGEIALAVANKNWDASIKALMGFPSVLARLSEDLAWTQKLGDAFLTNEEQILTTIQDLRQKAEQAGNLNNMDNVKIVREQKTIIIEPIQPEVIYVPYYDTRNVYGNWHWAHYPPVYWQLAHYNAHDYRAAQGLFYWHTGVHVSFNFFFNAFHWHERHIVVTQYHNTRRHVSYGRLVNNHHARRWQHNPVHRRGVSYSTGHLKQRYHSNRPSLHERKIARSDAYQKTASHRYVAQNSQVKRVNGKQIVHHKKRDKHQQLTNKLKRKLIVKNTRISKVKNRQINNHKPHLAKPIKRKTVIKKNKRENMSLQPKMSLNNQHINKASTFEPRKEVKRSNYGVIKTRRISMIERKKINKISKIRHQSKTIRHVKHKQPKLRKNP